MSKSMKMGFSAIHSKTKKPVYKSRALQVDLDSKIGNAIFSTIKNERSTR